MGEPNWKDIMKNDGRKPEPPYETPSDQPAPDARTAEEDAEWLNALAMADRSTSQEKRDRLRAIARRLATPAPQFYCNKCGRITTALDHRPTGCPYLAVESKPRTAGTDVSSRLAWQHCTERPRVVTLCGSTRFMDEFFRSGWAETLAGRLVFSVGVVVDHPGDADGGHVGEALGVKDQLDEIHFRKIDLSDEILVLNVDGYIGKSTQREIAYAIATGKGVRFLNPKDGEATLRERAHELGQQVAAFVEGRIPDAK